MLGIVVLVLELQLVLFIGFRGRGCMVAFVVVVVMMGVP